MPTKEILQSAGIFPGILYIGGWAFIGILVIMVIYQIIRAFVKAIK